MGTDVVSVDDVWTVVIMLCGSTTNARLSMLGRSAAAIASAA